MTNMFTFTLGRVATAVEAKSKFIPVWLMNDNFFSPQDIMDKEEEIKFDFDMGDGVKETFTKKVKQTKICKYISLGNPNRNSSPAFGGGETVLVMKMANHDEYFCTAFFSDLDLKGQEVFELLIPARKLKDGTLKPDVEADGTEISASYRFMVDTTTEGQQMLLRTSKFNGERCILTIMFDAKEGKLCMYTDEKDCITIEASNSDEELPATLRFHTEGRKLERYGDNAYIEVDKSCYMSTDKDVYWGIKGSTLIRSDKEIVIDTKSKCNINAKEELTLTSSKDINIGSKTKCVINAKEDINLTSLTGKVTLFSPTELGFGSPSVKAVVPDFNVTGLFSCSALNVSGAGGGTASPVMFKVKATDWSEFDKAMKKIKELNEITDEDEGGDGKRKKKEEQEPEEPVKPPEDVTFVPDADGTGANTDTVLHPLGKVDIKSGPGKNVTIGSGANIEIKAEIGTVSINGQMGADLTGCGTSLLQTLNQFDTQLTAAIPADIATMQVISPVGPCIIIAPMAQTIAAITANAAKMIAIKGGASFFNGSGRLTVSTEEHLDKLKEIRSKLKLRR